jgi:curved DNA-binding protein CbpA
MIAAVANDPITAAYAVLGVPAGASDDEVRSAYRRLVKLHHPDHNAGSPDAARRFEGIQDAYARVTKHRAARPHVAEAKTAPPPPRSDPGVESRLAQMEREVRAAAAAARQAAEQARERARAEARAAATGDDGRPSDEELGYYSTDDSFTKIFRDARSELSDRFADAREHPLAKRLEDLLDDFERRARP